MKTVTSSEKTVIEAESLVGTKWVAWPEFIGGRIKMEFVDKTTCIYTSEPNQYPLTYSVSEGNLLLEGVDGPFELRGDVLFNYGFPTFEKAA